MQLKEGRCVLGTHEINLNVIFRVGGIIKQFKLMMAVKN